MRHAAVLALAVSALALGGFTLSGCATGSDTDEAAAPAPAKPIDSAQFYAGRWYEIGRTPMKITDGCVAGTTDYSRDPHGRLIETDACHADSPAGKTKLIAGPVRILDSDNTKVSVRYVVFGVFPISKTYWMLDHGDDYRWFIMSDPDFKNINLFTRDPRPSQAEIDALTARARSLGYHGAALEYPARFPAGGG